MKKVVSILGLCILSFASVDADNRAQLTVKANVEAVVEITRNGSGGINLLGEEMERTAAFITKNNSDAKTKVTLASENAAGDAGNFNVKSGENRIRYNVTPNRGSALNKPGTFEIDSDAGLSLVFAPLDERNAYRAGNYTDIVTVTITAGEEQAGSMLSPCAGESVELVTMD